VAPSDQRSDAGAAGRPRARFRRDVGRGTRQPAGLRDRRVALRPRDAEVGEHRSFLADEHVARFDVAVQDPRLVRDGERAHHPQPDLGHTPRLERPVLLDHLVEGARGDQLHDDPGPVVLRDDVVDGDDARVGQPCGQSCFPECARVENVATIPADRGPALSMASRCRIV
jgi:hypothetical protein